jgi:hypothetical protein
MRVPPFSRYRRFTAAFGVFLLGMIAGAAVYNGLFHAHIDALISQNGEMESMIEQYEEEIRQLNRFKNQHTAIQSVQPYIEENRTPGQSGGPALDARTEAELKRRVKKDLSALNGHSIYEIDSDAKLVRLLLHRKVYRDVLERDYAVEIKTMLVVDNILKVWVSVSVYSPE